MFSDFHGKSNCYGGLWLLKVATLVVFVFLTTSYGFRDEKPWIHKGFDQFSKGRFCDGGSNIYVNAKGIIEMINTFDVNNDGYVDILVMDAHEQREWGQTSIYKIDKGPAKDLKHKQVFIGRYTLFASRVVDVDQDGYPDLIGMNWGHENGGEIPSFVFWGGPGGLGVDRSDLPTMAAHDVAVYDINRDGRLDLIFPSAFEDPHNPGVPMLCQVYLQQKDRQFEFASEYYGLYGTAAYSVDIADLNKDGYCDLALANNRIDYDDNTESVVYWGTVNGFDTKNPLRLPTVGATQVRLDDLDQDGDKDIVFCCKQDVRIYWNNEGKFNPEKPLIIGAQTTVSKDNVSALTYVRSGRFEIADTDGDGIKDLIIANSVGVQIRSGNDLENVKRFLKADKSRWVTASDLDGDGRLDLVVSKYDNGIMYDTESPIFWNGPSGFSQENVSWIPTQGAMGNTTGDLDGDGKPEVIFHSTMSGRTRDIPSYIYFGNKDAHYGVKHRMELPTHGKKGVVCDLNLDGFPEIVTTSPKGLEIFHGTPDGPNPHLSTIVPTANPENMDLDVADFNRDGYLDLLAVERGEMIMLKDHKPSTIFYGSANGFSQANTSRLNNYGNTSYVCDVNNDGYLDVLFHDKRDYVLIYLGSDDGYSDDRTWKVPCKGTFDSAMINVADLNRDGWLDIIVGNNPTRMRKYDTLRILYGSPQGYNPENSQELLDGFTIKGTGVADFNNDGNLDMVVTAYYSNTGRPIHRTPPALIFYGDGKRLDLKNPERLHAWASNAVMQLDFNRDGWIDIALANHRNDITQQVESMIYWNGPKGFSVENRTLFPALGPHGMYKRNFGNTFTRKPEEYYTCPPYNIGNRKPLKLHWESEETELLKIKFQVRWAAEKDALENAEWMGPDGKGTYYEASGGKIIGVPKNARWLQYKATLVSPYGCGSPKLREVRVEF